MQTDIEALFSTHIPDIRSAGYQSFDPVWSEKVHSTHGIELLHVVSGSIEEQMDERRYHAGPGDTLMIPSGVQHRDVFDPDTGLEVVFCVLTWDHECEFFQRVDNAGLLLLSPQCKAELASNFDSLRGNLSGATPADKLLARCRVLTILILALRGVLGLQERGNPESQPSGKRRRRELMRRAKAYLNQHYAAPITLEEVASALHVSAYYLSHVFSQESNFTLFAYLTVLRMERAKALLSEGNLNVSEVALAVGYQDPNYFSKAFRKQCGCSPKEFAVSYRGLRPQSI